MAPNRNVVNEQALANSATKPSSTSTASAGSKKRCRPSKKAQDQNGAKRSRSSTGSSGTSKKTSRVAAKRTAIAQRSAPKEAEVSSTAESSSNPKRGRPPKNHNQIWKDMFFELAVYKAKNGHCKVPSNGGGPLGNWIHHQRSKQGRDGLSEDQTAALNALGFVWNLRDEEADILWEKRFQELVAYNEKHGTTVVPQKEKSGFGQWVQRQRQAQNVAEKIQAGKMTRKPNNLQTMTAERKKKLDDIGFVWKIYENVIGWDGKYKELVEYKATNGDCLVPQHWPENKSLGKWVASCKATLSIQLIQTGQI